MQHLPLRTALAAAFCAAAFSESGMAQAAPATIIQIDVENRVAYHYDSNDYSRMATSPARGSIQTRTFSQILSLGDIVAVNGSPAKGLWVARGLLLRTLPAPPAGQAIGDVARTVINDLAFEILQPDGTPVGTILAGGLGGGPAPPGAPLASTGSAFVITGGTGAFLGVRGQAGLVLDTAPTRSTSVVEDPANRRINGGGGSRFVLHLIPLSPPEVVSTADGPTVLHPDFTQVTADKPARAGETLIAVATGLGPTRPGVDPGQPFPSSPGSALSAVNSPILVTVNGQPAQVINSVGWPGMVDTYRVDFRVPDGTASGAASIQLSAAWIAGHEVQVHFQ